MKKYSWFKNTKNGFSVIHTENKVITNIAEAIDAEKADFLTKACNQFDIEKYEGEKQKRLFQILDEMNVNDSNNRTATVGLCNSFISADKVKQGGIVTMGVPEEVVMDLFLGNKKIPILLIIDKKEYDRISNE